MHIADITEDVESLNIAIMHNLDEHMEAEETDRNYKSFPGWFI